MQGVCSGRRSASLYQQRETSICIAGLRLASHDANSQTSVVLVVAEGGGTHIYFKSI